MDRLDGGDKVNNTANEGDVVEILIMNLTSCF